MKKYFEKYGEPGVAFKMIRRDLKGAQEEVENGQKSGNGNGNGERVNQPDITNLRNASDTTFMDAYEERVKGTVPDKLANVVAKVTDLAESLDINIDEFLQLIERYCSLKNSQSNKRANRYL